MSSVDNGYEITAIPTVYAGVRFRSRLEARWAVFFDVLEIPWEYEPVTMRYRTRWGSQAVYTPDFRIRLSPEWVHGYDRFIEIKPNVTFISPQHHCEAVSQNHVAYVIGDEEFRFWNAYPRYGTYTWIAEELFLTQTRKGRRGICRVTPGKHYGAALDITDAKRAAAFHRFDSSSPEQELDLIGFIEATG